MEHDFKRNPELWDSQMGELYFKSPHKQIFEGFTAKVVKVTDGDTVRVETDFRDFDFPVRMLKIAAPELNEGGGPESQRWLESKILNKTVYISVDINNRVGKWGRLLGEIWFQGMSMQEESLNQGFSTLFDLRESSTIPDFNKELEAVF